MIPARSYIKPEITKLLQEFRMNRLKVKGVTDFTNVKQVSKAVNSCARHPHVRGDYLQTVSNNYPGVQTYEDTRHKTFIQCVTYITHDEFSLIKPFMEINEDEIDRGVADLDEYALHTVFMDSDEDKDEDEPKVTFKLEQLSLHSVKPREYTGTSS